MRKLEITVLKKDRSKESVEDLKSLGFKRKEIKKYNYIFYVWELDGIEYTCTYYINPSGDITFLLVEKTGSAKQVYESLSEMKKKYENLYN